MSRNIHEQLMQDEVGPPSARSTGIVFAVVAAILTAIFRNTPVLAIGFAGLSVLLGGLSWRCPQALEPLNRLWFKLGLVMHRVVNPVVMMALYAVVIVPSGLIMQLLRDPLAARRRPAGATYWVPLAPATHPPSSMRRQF